MKQLALISSSGFLQITPLNVDYKASLHTGWTKKLDVRFTVIYHIVETVQDEMRTMSNNVHRESETNDEIMQKIIRSLRRKSQ